MNRKTKTFIIPFIIALAIVVSGPSLALAKLDLPQPVGYVNDFASLLSQQEKNILERKLQSYEKQSGNEIVVVTVRNLQGTTVEDFAVRLFEKWKIGKKGKDNGVLLLVAKEERKIRIEVGYGLEPNLTDAQSYEIISRIISPAFKAGNFNQGIANGIDAIIKTISGEEVIPEQPAERIGYKRGFDISQLLYLGFFLIFFVFQWLVSVLGRTKSWWLGGLLGGIAGLVLMLFSVIVGIIAMAILVPLGLLFDYVVSRAYQEYKKHRYNEGDEEGVLPIPWWAGGHWGPGGSSHGGGFGGFGGGRSGGGGASGGW